MMKKLISIGFGALLLVSTMAFNSHPAVAKDRSMKDSKRMELKLNHRKHWRKERRRHWRRMHRRLSY